MDPQNPRSDANRKAANGGKTGGGKTVGGKAAGERPPVAVLEQPVSPRLKWLSEVVWRTAVLVAAFLVVAWVMWRLKIVVLPVFVALLLSTVLTSPVVALEHRGWPSGIATAAVFLSFLLIFAGVIALVVPPAVDGVAGLDTATASAVDDLEDWLVNGPLHLDREEVRQYTSDPAGQLIDLVQESSVSVSSGVRMVGETLVGAVLSLVLTFMFLKDGRRFQHFVISRLDGRRETVVRRAAARAWATFGGYLRGAAILGVVEGVIIGSTMWLVGAPLALPLAVITFIAAFFPVVGAVVAGVLAVLVTLAGAGFVPAVVVGVVAVLVQQLDNDLLSPFIYGRALEIHPVFILLVLTAGGAIGGIAGAFVAVPITAALVGAANEFWNARSVVDEMGPPEVDPSSASTGSAGAPSGTAGAPSGTAEASSGTAAGPGSEADGGGR